MATISKTWKDFELLDRQSTLINEDGSKDELNPELAQALLAHLGPMPEAGLRTFLRDLLADEGIASLEDLSGESLTTIIQGILS